MHQNRLIDVSRPFVLPAAFWLAWLGAVSALAGEPVITHEKIPGTSLKPNRQEVPAAPAQCRMNFFRKDWSDVLNQVAEDTHSTLVMPEVPPGKFTRLDNSKHNREDAVRILNRDLVKLGYRLVARNDVLEVVPIKQEHPEYQAAQVRTEADKQAAAARADAAEGRRTAQSPPAADQGAPSVQRASHETPESPPAPTSVRIQPRQRAALDIAKHIHATFKQRSRLENAGPHGLPAFVVDHFAPQQVQAGRPLFTMEIDTTNNELIVTAEASVQTALQQLIRKVDLNPLGPDAMPALVAGNGQAAEAGQKLAQPLSLIAQVRQQQPGADGSAPPSPVAPSAPADSSAPPQPGGQAQTERELPSLLGNLKGDVSIEALNDLDLLILRGNEKDVEAVMQVIRAIEKLAVGSLPEIHLLRLQFVDSQSLAQLLNDVYTRMTELRSNNAQQSQVSVRVVPVVVPNAVLILAPANAMQAVLDLADELDQPIDPTHEVQVFRLKHAVATTVVEMLTAFYTQPPAGLGTRLKVAADARTNSIVVQANPRDLSEIAEMIKGVDSEQAGSVSRLRVFPLKSAVADELATFLNNAIQSTLAAPTMRATTGLTGQPQGQAQGTTATQQAKATVLEFLAEGSDTLIRSGLLNDIRFNADPRTNSLLVTAPEQSMPLVEELIRILDRPSSALAEIKVFPLKNADAINAAQLLGELFNTTQNQTGRTGTNTTGALGVELLGAQGSGSSLVPLRFSVDARTNSVVAVGGAEALRIVEAILLRLDSNNARNRQTTVIKLRNSPVSDVASAINQFLTSQRDLATLDPDRISTSQLLEQEIIVTAEPVTNSLLISATPAYFTQIEEIAKKLDAEPAQVVIQAMLVEVELNNTDEFGVELGFQDPVLFSRSLIDQVVTTTTTTTPVGQPQVTTTNIISQNATPGFNFNNQPFGGNNRNTSTNGTVGSQGLSNFGVGRTNSDLGYGGLVLSASSDSVSVLIRALAARRTVRVLSRPQIMALDNQIAEIQVGQVVPVVSGVTITGVGTVNPTILRDPAGIILTVSPRISPEGQIVMEVAAEKSLYGGAEVPIYTDVTTGAVVNSPIKDITTARTTVKVPDGQTIVVGGMITKNDTMDERKVPWLGDLPIVGKAFRYDAFTYKRTELLIFLTPRIIHGDGDMETVKQVEAGRLHFFQDDVESLHGPLFAVPRDMTLPIHDFPSNIEPLPAPPAGTSPIPPAPITPSAGAKAIDDTAKARVIYQAGAVPEEP